MKRKTGSILLSCVMGAALLSGCTITISPASPGTSSDTAVQSGQETEGTPSSGDLAAPSPTSSSQAAQATATPSPMSTKAPKEEVAASPSGNSDSEENQEFTDLSFLDEEQQRLYSLAYEVSAGLYGLGSNLMTQWTYNPVKDDNGKNLYVDDAYVLYDVSYDDFSTSIHQIFTDNCLKATDFSKKFINYQGRVAVHSTLSSDIVEGYKRQVIELYPDSYRLIRATESEVTFHLVSHYDRNGWGDVDTPIDVYTIEYPICMVKTDEGWRFDEFHTTEFG